jgi:hypothetical protein
MKPATSIKTIKQFISTEEIAQLCSYNDELLDTKADLFFIGNSGKRPVLQFGKDNSQKHSQHSMSGILSPQIQGQLRAIFSKVIDTISQEYGESKQLYICSFWFAKQLPGANVAAHDDTDEGANTHFKYSAVLYLNTLINTGSLDFISLGYSVKPEAGDLVIFPSQGTGLHEVKPIDQTRYTIPMWFTDDPSYAF